MVSVTLTVRVTPPPVTVTVALYVPAARLVMLAVAATDPFPDPEEGLTVSHDAFVLAVQLPLDVTVNDWAAGFAAPCTAE